MKLFLKKAAAVLLAAFLLLGSIPMPAAAANTTLTGVTPDMAFAYAQVLKDLQTQYGTYRGSNKHYGDSEFHNVGSGVAYARLIDFDGDGRDELYTYSITAPDDQMHYLYETIWMCAADGKTANCISNNEYYSDGTVKGEDTEDIFFYNNGGKTYLYKARYDSGFGYYGGTETTVYKVTSNGLSVADSMYEEWEISNSSDYGINPEAEYEYSCAINGDTVCSATVSGIDNVVDYSCREAAAFYEKYPKSDMTKIITCTFDWSHNDVDALIAELETLALEKMDAAAVLEKIPYFGDRSLCKMNADMARAFADAIRNDEPHSLGVSHSKAMLADISGDGNPVLLLYHPDPAARNLYLNVYQYIDGGIIPFYDLGEWNASLISRHSKAGSFIVSSSSDADSMEHSESERIYTAKNGSMHLEHTLYVVFSQETAKIINASVDGKSVSAEYYENLAEYYKATESDSEIISVFSGMYDTSNNLESVANLLELYAGKVGAYAFENVTLSDNEYVKAAVEAAAQALGGNISAIYKLSDNLYYVIITVDGSEKGALVKGAKENGQIQWKITETYETPAPRETLDAALLEDQSKSNITIDYTRALGTPDAVAASLQEILDNINGIAPNDAAKQQLAEFTETAVSSAAVNAVKGKNNMITVSDETVSAAAESARTAEERYLSMLEQNGVSLNRTLKIIISVVWNNAKIGEPCQITFDRSVSAALNGATLQVFLGDQQHYLQVPDEYLKSLLDQFDSFSIQIQQKEKLYTVNFMDAAGNVIEEIPLPVLIALPCDSITGTVMATYSKGSDNWGGQYDPNYRVLSFETPYSGQYEVIENSLNISDISGLDTDTQAAINFMTSKGFFRLTEDMFLPDMMLTRYDFCQALVGMFYSLDRNLTTSFSDVPVDSRYYPYVASGEHTSIIKGYDDGTFSGDKLLSVEQMLSLAARTLIEKKGYYEPEDADMYLNRFVDGLDTSAWAQNQVALAIREGLVDGYSELSPKAPVSRAQAAVILYRLFLLLNEVTPVSLDLPLAEEADGNGASSVDVSDEAPAENETKTRPSLVVPIAISAAAAACAGGAAAWYFLIRRKK